MYPLEGEPVPLEKARQKMQRPRLGLMPFKDIRPSVAAAYLVKNLIPREGLTVIWGPPKSGKSFLAFDISMSIARQCDWRAKRVRGGPVVYVAAEGASGFRARVEAYRQRHLSEDQEDPAFYLVPDVLGLPADTADLIASIRRGVEDVTPALVVLDTLNRTLIGSENAPEDMTAYVRACDSIREAFACAVMVVHHCGTEGTRPRGHTSLTGAADAQVAVKKNGGIVCATVEHMKDGEEGETLHSRLEVVTVGQNEDGDDITSCVIVETKEAPETPAGGRRLSKNQQSMLSLLHDAKAAGLSVDQWNDAAREIGLGSKRRSDLYDLRAALQGKGLVYQHGERWFVRQPQGKAA